MPIRSLPDPSDSRGSERLVRELDRRLERLDREILVADWNLFTGRSRHGSAPWQLKRAALLSDDRLLSWVRSALRRDWTRPTRRRLELLERILLDAQVEQNESVVRLRSALQERVVSFRPLWNGKKVNRARIFQVLYESDRESDRRRAYYAFEPLHRPLESSLVELVQMRNERARELGFRTFAEMRLGFQGLTPPRLQELAEDASRSLRDRLREFRDRFRGRSRQSAWHPWDFEYAWAHQVHLPVRLFPYREMLPRIRTAISRWGFPIERMRFRVVFHDIPAVGLTLAPDPPREVRIVVHPRGGWVSYMVMFHEVGHAVHSSLIRSPKHLLRWHENIPGFGAFHEGIGGLFEDLASKAEWLSTVPGVGEKRAREFEQASHFTSPLGTARQASWLRIEQRLYQNPASDPMPEVQRFERHIFGFDDYKPISFVDSFFVDDPVYASNYLLANLFGAQVRGTLRDLYGDPVWPNRKVGPWLTRNWFAPGSYIDWIPHLKEVTGRPFGTAAFRSELTNPH
ncbi:MAG TPA: hypothetical protein VEE83_03480 [Thermoplasmata archaeon]|nr:hypothetical protein [Thermoplasmata archaeon]